MSSSNIGIYVQPRTGDVQVTGNVLPTSCNVYDLGSAAARWRDLYLSGDTIDLGGTFLKRDAVGGGIKIESEGGEEVDTNVRNVHASGYVNIAGTRLERHVTGPLMVKTGAGEGQMESGMFKHVYVDGTANASNVAIVAGAAAGAEPALSVKQYGTQPIADLWDANTLAVRVADGGNVGIGTGTPMAKLHVDGNIFATGTVTASNLSVIGDFVTMNTVTSNTEQVVVTNAGTGPALKVTQTGAQPIADFYDDGGVLALRVADGGNVGIGTTFSGVKVRIQDNSASSTQLQIVSDNVSSRAGIALTSSTNAAFYVQQANNGVAVLENYANASTNFYQKGTVGGFLFHTSDNNNQRMVITNDGNVGIGTVTPLAKLDVVVPSFNQTFLNMSVINHYRFRLVNNGNDFIIDANGDQEHRTSLGTNNGTGRVIIKTAGFAVGSTERMRVDWNGYVGIGTTNPQSLLHVVGDIRCVGSTSSDVPWNNNFRIWNRDQISYTELHVHFGNVGGSTPAAQLRFMYGNSVAFRTARDSLGFEYGWVTLSGSFPSSIKYKYNIAPLSLGLRDVLSLQPVEFKWKVDICGNKKDTPSFGFIAEEMHSINEMFVQYDMDGNIETVRYQLLTALLTKAIQELHSKVCSTKTISGMVRLNGGIATVNVYDVLKISKDEFDKTYSNIRRHTSNESGFANVKSLLNDGLLTIICQDTTSCDDVFWQLTFDVTK